MIKVYALIALMLLGVVALITAGIAYDVAVWRECRVDHSWFYCWRLISR